jgi:phage baseplate assembly protein W
MPSFVSLSTRDVFSYLFQINTTMATSQTFQRSNIFKDFDMSFSKHPLTGDVGVKTDINSINQALRNLINTNYFDRLFQPLVGCNIRAILFEPADPITIADLRQAIRDTITNYEPRVTLSDIFVEDLSDRNQYNIRIVYFVNYKAEPIQLDVILERLR